MTKLFTVVSIESEFGRQIYTDLVHAESKHDAFYPRGPQAPQRSSFALRVMLTRVKPALMAGYDLVACDDWLNGSVPLTEPQAIALIEVQDSRLLVCRRGRRLWLGGSGRLGKAVRTTARCRC